MALYVTREGAFTTVNVWTNLTQFAGQTVNAITVPSGYGAIKELWVAAGPDGAATDNQGATFSVRLQGSGLKYGPVDIPVGGWSYLLVGNQGKGRLTYSLVIPVDIALNPQGEIWVKATQNAAADIGTPEMAVTCVFAKGTGGMKYYQLRDMNIACVTDTVYPATHSSDDTAAGRFRVPAGCTRITKLFGVAAGIIIDATGGSFSAKLRGNGLRDGDIVLPIGGVATQASTAGCDGGTCQAVVVPTELAVVPGGEIVAEFIFAGTASGASDCAVGIEFSG